MARTSQLGDNAVGFPETQRSDGMLAGRVPRPAPVLNVEEGAMIERNRETDATWQFHNATKYVRTRGASGADELLMGEPPNLGPALGEQDPAIEPLRYKIYTSLEPIPLPRPPESPNLTTTALDALASTGDVPAGQAIPNLVTLARLCLRSNGLLKQWRSPAGREVEFRAAGCTGARYHLELYLVCAQLPDLDAGVYQYAAHDHSLRLLRAGDCRASVVEATGDEPAVAQAPVIAVCTSTFWRNAWRYQARAYRHVYWDTGTVLANLLAVAADERLPARVVLGFADPEINALLDVDGRREAAISLVALGRSDDAPPTAPEIGPLRLATQPLSAREIEFPEIVAMHGASSLTSGREVAAWRSQPLRRTPPSPSSDTTPLRPIDPTELPKEPIDAVIQRRRSNRHYAAETSLSFAAFSTVLDRSMRGTTMDCLDPAAPQMHNRYLIVNNVEGLAPGTYVAHRDQHALELLAEGDARGNAARLACGQSYAADAHVNVYALTDLAPVLGHYGNRGYRVAQLEAALFAAKLQLAAHALGLGAVGSTSVDDEVTDFFAPHAAGKSFMFVAVFGHRRRPSQTEVAESSRFLQR